MSRDGQTLTTHQIDVSRLSLPLPVLTLSGGTNINPYSQQGPPIHANIKPRVLPAMGNVPSLEGEGDIDPERRFNNAFQHNHEGSVNNNVSYESRGLPALSPESPRSREQRYNESLGSPKNRDIWNSQSLRDGGETVGNEHASLILSGGMPRKRPRSPSPSDRMIPTGPRMSNGVRPSSHDPRDFTINGKAPPTGPRAGAGRRRPSPDLERWDSRDDPRNRAPYRRDHSPESNGYFDYRFEKNRRQDVDARPSYKRDSYRPGYFNPETRRWSAERDRSYRDSSRSPPPRRDFPDQSAKPTGHALPNPPSRQSTRDNTSQERSERSLSPRQRARKVADEINRRMMEKSQSNSVSSPRTDSSSARRRSDAEAPHAENFLPPRKLSNVSEPLRSPLPYYSADPSDKVTPPNDMSRVQNHNERSVIRNNALATAPTTKAPGPIVQNGISHSISNYIQPTIEQHTSPPSIPVALTNPPSLPPKPPVIQSPNLSYESRYRVVSSPARHQDILNLQLPVGDTASVNSDVVVDALKSTSSVSSASVTSSEMRSKKCHVCKGDRFSEYDGGIGCSSCKRLFHLRCEQQATSGDTSQEGIGWRCTRCVKKSLAPSTLIATPHRSSINSILNSSSRQPSVSVGRKSILPSAEGEPPQKRLRTDSGDFSIYVQTMTNVQGSGQGSAMTPGEDIVMATREESSGVNGYKHTPQDLGGKFRLSSWKPVGHDEMAVRPDITQEPTSSSEARLGGDRPAQALQQPQMHSTDQTAEISLLGSPELGSDRPAYLATRGNDSLKIAYLTSPDADLLTSAQDMPTLYVQPVFVHTSATNSDGLVEKPEMFQPPMANMGSQTTIPDTPERPSADQAGPTLANDYLSSGRDNPSNDAVNVPTESNAATGCSAPSQLAIVAPKVVTTDPEKADDELSDTSMSIDSAHSQSPEWKGTPQVTMESEESSPPYSPRLDAFAHIDQRPSPTVTNTATQQSETPSLNEQRASSSSVPASEASALQKKPAASYPKCLKCGKGVLKGSTGETASVLCGNCTSIGTSQLKDLSSGISMIPESPALNTGLYLPRSNSYISPASVRKRPEPDPLVRPKPRKTVARKVAAAPNRAIEPKPVPASRPIMRKANELRAPEKNKQQTLQESLAKTAIPNSPNAKASNEQISDKARLEETLNKNEKLQESLDKHKVSLQNYASKTSSLSKELEEKNRSNQELTNEVKKLNDYVVLLRKKIEETNKLTEENRSLHMALTQALNEHELRQKEYKSATGKLGERLTHAEQDKQQAIKERNQVLLEKQKFLEEKQKFLEERQLLTLEKQQALDEVQHAKAQKERALEEKQQAILASANERQQFLTMQKLHETLQNRKAANQQRDPDPTPDPASNPAPAKEPAVTPAATPTVTLATKKSAVPYADLDYGIFNPLESYSDINVIVGNVGDVPAIPNPQFNPSRRFKKQRWKGRLDFNLKDRRYIHRRREGLPEALKEKAAKAESGLIEWSGHPPEAANGVVDGNSSSSEDGDDPQMTIEQLLSVPTLPMPTIQDNGRLCFRDGTLGANGKLPRAKIFHRVGKIDLAGQIR